MDSGGSHDVFKSLRLEYRMKRPLYVRVELGGTALMVDPRSIEALVAEL